MTRYYRSSQHTTRFISVPKLLLKIFPLTLFTLTVSILNSCEEGPTKIGIDLLPGNDSVSIRSIDTLSAWSYTKYDESVRTDNPSVCYLGQLFDPYFGTTTAEFVTQIRMAEPWDDKPYTIDSVELHLKLVDVKGGSGVTHTLRLSEIAEKLYTSSEYYSDKSVDTTGYSVTAEMPILHPDTINNIVIKLDSMFGIYLTRDTAKLFYSNTKDDFRTFFKGLYFQMSSNSDPTLVSLSLTPPSTGEGYKNFIVLYMHEADSVRKQFLFVLDAVNKNASFNRFSHNFTTATMGQNIAEIINKESKPTASDTLSYLQFLNGVYSLITLPGLESIKTDPSFNGIAVNKASLTIPVFFDGNIYKASNVPPQLYLRYKTLSGSKYFIPDYVINPSFLGGKIDSTANVYYFNIPAFVQNYLDDVADTIKPELEIYQGTGTRNVILKANTSKPPVKFEFTYTKF